MVFCRWSSDGWRCDLYCYQDLPSGYVTHVAAYRRALPLSQCHWEEAHGRLLHTRTPIGGPSDGKTFRDETAEGLHRTLTRLRQEGYGFPDDVLEAVEGQALAEALAQPMQAFPVRSAPLRQSCPA